MTTPHKWRVVPETATEDMIAAGWIDKEDVDPDDIYAAMLASAPPPGEELVEAVARAIHEAYWRSWSENRGQTFNPAEHETDWREWLDEATAVLSLLTGGEPGKQGLMAAQSKPVVSSKNDIGEASVKLEGER